MASNRFLIWGGEGWIAGQLKKLLESQGKEVYTTTIRMENREAVVAELDRVKPTHVLNCAGCTGRPNVDWCETNKEATVRSNVIGTISLTDACYLKGIHITVFATGCIYVYDAAHPREDDPKNRNGPGFLETDKANFAGSFYSETKAHVEEVGWIGGVPHASEMRANEMLRSLSHNSTGHEVLQQLPDPPPPHARQRRPGRP
jgi:nucleoside-diphosphate-sugar epimerase